MSASPGLVVVGASLAGLRAVEAARKVGFDGPVVLVGAEEHLPYDRPPLSKAVLEPGDDPEPTTFSTREELDELGVTLRLGAPATGLDVDASELLLGDERLRYDALVVATGSHARNLPGAPDLDGVHRLRTVEDAHAVRTAFDAGARTVVVGAGFIGSEVASAARARGADVTVVEMAPVPLVRAVGEEMGQACAALHRRNGTDLRCGVAVEALEGDGRVERVRLSDGSTLDADLVVVGTGAAPSTGWLTDSTLTVDDGVVCDETLAAAPDVWAAGDVARWHNPQFDRSMRLEHWTSAAEQGARAARNALADPDDVKPYATVPYFWSDWYGSKWQMVGIADAEEVAVVRGSVDEDAFVALYRSGDRVVGALALNTPHLVMKLRARIKRGDAWDDVVAFTRG